MNIRTMGLVLLLALLRTAPSSANITALNVELTDPGTVVPSSIANDLLINFTGGLQGQELHLTLTQGSMFQGPSGSDTPPSQVLLGPLPSLRYDSFVALGGLTSETSAPVETYNPGLCVQALGFECGVLLNGSSSIGWRPSTGTEVPSGADFVVARLTFSDDARGSVLYRGSTAADTGVPYFAMGTIHNGIISFVPEPASWMLVAWTAVVAVGATRRRYFSRAIVR